MARLLSEKVCQDSVTQYNFHVSFIGLLRLKKRSTEKKTPWERLPKATDWKVYACSDIDLGEVLFHYVVFCDKKKQGSFEQDLSCFLRRNFLRFGVPLNIFVPFLVPVDKKKIHKSKFEIDEENTKLQIVRKLPL